MIDFDHSIAPRLDPLKNEDLERWKLAGQWKTLPVEAYRVEIVVTCPKAESGHREGREAVCQRAHEPVLRTSELAIAKELDGAPEGTVEPARAAAVGDEGFRESHGSRRCGGVAPNFIETECDDGALQRGEVSQEVVQCGRRSVAIRHQRQGQAWEVETGDVLEKGRVAGCGDDRELLECPGVAENRWVTRGRTSWRTVESASTSGNSRKMHSRSTSVFRLGIACSMPSRTSYETMR